MKMLSQNGFPLSQAYSYTRRLFWGKRSLNYCTVLYFSELKWFHENFWSYRVHQRKKDVHAYFRLLRHIVFYVFYV
jgi:hypothetical protein